VNVSLRPLMVPGVALASAGVVALGPAMVAPPAVTLAAPAIAVPAAHTGSIQLASFALDLYDALEGWVAFGVQVLQDFLFWAPGLGEQIGALYESVQPIIREVVAFVVRLVEAPGDLFGAVTSLVSSVLGVSPLAAAAVTAAPPRPVAGRTGDDPRPAAAVAAPAEAPAGEALAEDAAVVSGAEAAAVAEPVADTVAEPVVEPVAEILVEPVAEPVAVTAAEPVVETVAGTRAESVVRESVVAESGAAARSGDGKTRATRAAASGAEE
jgi:hypothetical protein